VFQVIRVVDREHVLAISGNDHNDVRTRIRPTSDVIGWRDVTEENTASDKPVVDTAMGECNHILANGQALSYVYYAGGFISSTRNPVTIELPITGMAENRLVMTVAAQKLI
jgi:hypothetical protein